ncbi:MAG: anti-sigma regulatory factor [Massilia sp.]|jgi:serine/threonine-protein kinase RsbT|uniref:anti-sigma regulatory factor n=1 Tax=Massilia sp. TaxID=1882437 RepID=UPI0019BE661F|nr:anti-sigma regulatory factor [Oxalobacteraceae sp. CFBP 8761]MBD8563848.1 anti-sigma regulatory factor [Oxalobacteraceae sp. CFBP 8763]MBD8626473.1 anti-sigma regulatory factor [Oxalobacteraceae sp. CFBP 8753]MBD8723122.1 anti-sigma regulatory factor [Oxalobacteraceae sp. CFBP 13708]
MVDAQTQTVLFETPLLEHRRAQRTGRVTLRLRSDEDVVGVRKQVRERAVAIGLSLVDQTKLVTAASELARNTIKYGGGGEVHLDAFDDGARLGIGLLFVDAGQGIPNIESALRDGFTTGGGLGLGLGGSKRLVDEFDIDSRPKEGTAVLIIKWKR